MSKNSWCIIEVYKSQAQIPEDRICPANILKQARLYTGKGGYRREEFEPCDDHDDGYGFGYVKKCPNCRAILHEKSPEQARQDWVEWASRLCTRTQDTWVVDTDTQEIVAAFEVQVVRLL